MKIYEVTARTPHLTAELLTVWEASVRATHLFLSDAEILQIKEYVPQALQGIAHLIVAEDDAGAAVGFMGIEDGRLEMLFLSPAARGQGLGPPPAGIRHHPYGVRELTVNEQNPQAVGFYKHMGFATYRRTETDEQGRPILDFVYAARMNPMGRGGGHRIAGSSGTPTPATQKTPAVPTGVFLYFIARSCSR